MFSKKYFTSLVCFFAIISAPHFVSAEQEIRILDVDGKTQSVVELDESIPDQMAATVRVSLVSSIPGEASIPIDDLRGVEVSLVKVVNEREGDVVQTAKTFKNGVATFNSIPPGLYKVRIECEQMIITNAAVTGAAVVSRAAGAEAAAPETLDQIHLIDSQGASRAMGEVPLGKNADVSIAVGDSSKENSAAPNVRVLLVEVEKDTEEEIEVYAAQFTNEQGLVAFTNVPGGLFKIRTECPRFNVDGVGFLGNSVLSCICPWNILNTSAGTVSEMAAPVSATTTAVGTSTATTGLSATTTAIAVPAAAGAVVVVPDIVDPSQSTVKSQQK